MSSNWIRTALKYALLLAPTVLLAGVVALIAAGGWVAMILTEPARFADAPRLIQTLTRSTYWHTRRHWHTVPECVEFDRELLYRPRPGQCIFENAEFRTTMHFDEPGIRRTAAPSRDADPPHPRIVVLGDSHAMGWGVEDSETFASVLAADFGYEVVNLAVSSYATPRELRRLERDIALRPDDVVLIQYCDNDLEENLHFAASGRSGPYAQADLERLFGYARTPVSALPIAGVLLREIWKSFAAIFGAQTDDPPGRSHDPTRAFLATLSASPALRGRPVLAMAINASGRKTHLDSTALTAAGIPLIEPALTPQDFFAIDDHMLPRGHRAVANAIAGKLRERARQPLANMTD